MTIAISLLSEADKRLWENKFAPDLADLIVNQIYPRLRIALVLGDDRVITAKEAAAAINRSVSALEGWRKKGLGPPWVQVGARQVGYRLGDLRAYLKSFPPGDPAAATAMAAEGENSQDEASVAVANPTIE